MSVSAGKTEPPPQSSVLCALSVEGSSGRSYPDCEVVTSAQWNALALNIGIRDDILPQQVQVAVNTVQRSCRKFLRSRARACLLLHRFIERVRVVQRDWRRYFYCRNALLERKLKMWLKYRHALTSAEIADMVRGSIAFMSSVYKLQLYLPVSQDWDDERMLDEFSARYPDRCIMMEVTMQMYEEARLKARAAKKACKDAPPALETITAPGGEETDWFSIEEAERRYNIVKFTDMARGYMSDERLAEVIRPEVLPSLPEEATDQEKATILALIQRPAPMRRASEALMRVSSQLALLHLVRGRKKESTVVDKYAHYEDLPDCGPQREERMWWTGDLAAYHAARVLRIQDSVLAARQLALSSDSRRIAISPRRKIAIYPKSAMDEALTQALVRQQAKKIEFDEQVLPSHSTHENDQGVTRTPRLTPRSTHSSTPRKGSSAATTPKADPLGGAGPIAGPPSNSSGGDMVRAVVAAGPPTSVTETTHTTETRYDPATQCTVTTTRVHRITTTLLHCTEELVPIKCVSEHCNRTTVQADEELPARRSGAALPRANCGAGLWARRTQLSRRVQHSAIIHTQRPSRTVAASAREGAPVGVERPHSAPLRTSKDSPLLPQGPFGGAPQRLSRLRCVDSPEALPFTTLRPRSAMSRSPLRFQRQVLQHTKQEAGQGRSQSVALAVGLAAPPVVPRATAVGPAMWPAPLMKARLTPAAVAAFRKKCNGLDVREHECAAVLASLKEKRISSVPSIPEQSIDPPVDLKLSPEPFSLLNTRCRGTAAPVYRPGAIPITRSHEGILDDAEKAMKLFRPYE